MDKKNKGVVIIIIALVIGTITNGVFYLQESSKLKNAELRIAALEGDAPLLKGGISTLEGDFSALQGDILALEGGVSALGGDVSTLEGNLLSVEGDVSNLEGNLSSVEGNVSTLEGNISTLEAELVGADVHSILEVVAIIEPSVVWIGANLGGGSGVISGSGVINPADMTTLFMSAFLPSLAASSIYS